MTHKVVGGQFQLGSIVSCLLLETFLCTFLRNSCKCIMQFSSYDSTFFFPQGQHRVCVCASVCAQLCPTLCDPMDYGPPGTSFHGILQERILEWVAISFSRGSSQPRDRTCVSCISCLGRQIVYHCAPGKYRIEAPFSSVA